jgi:hypothetical protein
MAVSVIDENTDRAHSILASTELFLTGIVPPPLSKPPLLA